VRTRDHQWLLIKHRDRHASTTDITLSEPASIVSGRLLAAIAADEGGDVDKAKACDEPKSSVRKTK
jgi:hypothetical protein